ncbi:PIN domain-like protein [Suillus subluteus]|nr:PIN domain-like protein [Suillus subluteus]
MGVHGLWTHLKPNVTTESLTALALDGRYTTGHPPFRPFVIGVDISVWFEQCQQVARGRAHAQSGQNPPLRTFIFRTARLVSFPVQVVFAYDGLKCPALKRGRKWFMAEGEAEAELAAMNRTGTIDAVMTDDSDVFAFGGRLVL